jgi:potassium-transporting ATPase KdpC subunit
MRKDLVTSALAVVAFTVVLGLAYPLAITGISQVAFPHKADGSPLPGGSALLARPREGARYFRPRPSQTGYGLSPTAFSNRGPNQRSAEAFYRAQLAAYVKRERPFTPGLTAARVPVDAVTESASGVDPHISVANAGIQANRVARVRGIAPARVRALVGRYTDGRFLGLFGEPGVNVTRLNLALDEVSR